MFWNLYTKTDELKIVNGITSFWYNILCFVSAIPVDAASESDHVAIVVTARGGHIGFMEGIWPFHKNQYMLELFGQFIESMFYRDGFKLFTDNDVD